MIDNNISISHRKNILKLSIQDSVLMRKIFPIIQNSISDLLDEFYGNRGGLLARFDLTPEQHAMGIMYLKRTQIMHWRKLFLGGFEAGYEESVRRTMLARSNMGLEPASYVGSYLVLLRSLTAVIGCLYENPEYPIQANETAARIISAASRAIMLDMDLAISTHLDTVRTDDTADRARDTATLTVDSLRILATQVDEVVRFIQGLASETRLHALKISIDAMGAALETHAGISNIVARMVEIRQAANHAVAGIYDTIEEINVLTNSVAASINKQIAATVGIIRIAHQPDAEERLPAWDTAPRAETAYSGLGAFVSNAARFRR